MSILAALTLDPASIAAWLAIGLALGWTATKVLGDATYGGMGDLILGGLGGLAGGFSFGVFSEDAGFWGSAVVAAVGACVLIAGARTVTFDRSA